MNKMELTGQSKSTRVLLVAAGAALVGGAAGYYLGVKKHEASSIAIQAETVTKIPEHKPWKCQNCGSLWSLAEEEVVRPTHAAKQQTTPKSGNHNRAASTSVDEPDANSSVLRERSHTPPLSICSEADSSCTIRADSNEQGNLQLETHYAVAHCECSVCRAQPDRSLLANASANANNDAYSLCMNGIRNLHTALCCWEGALQLLDEQQLGNWSITDGRANGSSESHDTSTVNNSRSNSSSNLQELANLDSVSTQNASVGKWASHGGSYTEVDTLSRLRISIKELLSRVYEFKDEYENALMQATVATAAADMIMDEAARRARRTESRRAHRPSALVTSTSRTDSEVDEADLDQRSMQGNDDVHSVSGASFQSALDYFDVEVAGIDTDLQAYPHFRAYCQALERIRAAERDGDLHAAVAVRSMRTAQLGCASDVEYLAKVLCLRDAFDVLLTDVNKQRFLADRCRQTVVALLACGGKDSHDFVTAFDDCIAFVTEPANRDRIFDELKARGVKKMNLFDVYVDYILLDSFDELESPPASVLAITQNRWLSTGFKETALTTAVWSVLKAKRKLLKDSNGFKARYYSLLEIVSPLLACGFFGVNAKLTEPCQVYKTEMLKFAKNLFRFDKCHYTTKEALAEDIFSLAKACTSTMLDGLSKSESQAAAGRRMQNK